MMYEASIRRKDIKRNREYIFSMSINEAVVTEHSLESVREIINDWDPIGLFPMAPDDEYEYEIKKIYEYILDNVNIGKKELASYISSTFIELFGIDSFTASDIDCLSIAEQILNADF